MMDAGVALEALGVFCNTEVTSFQRPGRHFTSNTVASHETAPSLLSISNFILQVLNGDAHRPVPEDTFREILSPQELAIQTSRLSISADEDSKGNLQLVVNEDEFFDPRFDYDFTNITDRKTFYRGGEVYERPCGWKRFALKVLGKYDEDTWLGHNHRKTRSVAGEWPVSYHGTSLSGAEGIIEGNYNMEKAKREKYGWGVYSTPDISVAEDFATEFRSKKTKKWYKVLLQNRINHDYREICDNDKYWLVKIPKGTSEEEEKEMVNRAIRPYGLLLREI